MLSFDGQFEGVVCGIDEAGRGPLAGPVCAAAVVLPKGCEIAGLDDSKKLSAKKRTEIYGKIMETAVFGFAMVSPEEIDKINILQATLKAMALAAEDVYRHVTPDVVLVDGTFAPDIRPVPRRLVTVVKGDQLSAAIAAASVVAKVVRDNLMIDAARLYPEYGFERHKGYGTKAHIEAVKKYGLCPIHRRTFIKGMTE